LVFSVTKNRRQAAGPDRWSLGCGPSTGGAGGLPPGFLPVAAAPSGDLGVAKDVGVLSDLLGERPTAGYPDDTKSLVLQRFPQRAIP
jgi:hypothetical protein